MGRIVLTAFRTRRFAMWISPFASIVFSAVWVAELALRVKATRAAVKKITAASRVPSAAFFMDSPSITFFPFTCKGR